MTTFDSDGLAQGLLQAGDGACAMTPDGRIALWNDAAERLLGHTAREVTGRACCEVFAGRDQDGNRLCHAGCRVTTLVRMGERIQHFEMLTHAKDGRAVWLDVSVVVLPAPGGSSFLYLFRDVTAQRELRGLLGRGAGLDASAGDAEGAGTKLTRRELEVLRLVAQGQRTKAIAATLLVSPATVRNHVQNILGKLGAHNRLEAVAQMRPWLG